MRLRRKTRLATLGAAAACAALGVQPAGSLAAASLERVTAERGQWVAPGGQGCVPSTVTLPLRGSIVPTSFGLPQGQSYEFDDEAPAWTVSDVRAADGNATWTLQPAPSCPASDPSDEWRFSYSWTTRKYVIRTKPRTGVRSVGGFRINAKATVKAARRKFGRPSRVHRPSRQVCTLTWRKIGLRMTFVNWGGVRACSHGWAQSAVVFRPQMWAVQVGTRKAVTTDSSLADLVDSELAERIKGGWQLDDFYTVIGDEGYYPSVVALAGGANRTIRGFDFWLGQGGD